MGSTSIDILCAGISNGGVTRILPLLLATLALLASDPAHGWLHGEGPPVLFQGVELHGDDCHHFDEVASHHHDCVVCIAGRVGLAAPGANLSVSVVPTADVETAAPLVMVAWSWTPRALGARAPPVHG